MSVGGLGEFQETERCLIEAARANEPIDVCILYQCMRMGQSLGTESVLLTEAFWRQLRQLAGSLATNCCETQVFACRLALNSTALCWACSLVLGLMNFNYYSAPPTELSVSA